MKYLICGILGKMGENLLDVLSEEEDAEIIGVDQSAGVMEYDTPFGEKAVKVFANFGDVDEPADVIVDFSSPTVLEDELEWAKANSVPVVLATTGYTPEQIEYIGECAKVLPVFRTANFSLGVNLLQKLVKEAAEALGEAFDIEIIERHHNRKADAPSGTALMLAEAANSAFDGEKELLCSREGTVGRRGKEIGLHAVRGGTIVGEHEVVFAGEDEIVTLAHSARSKKVFAVGAVRAARWLAERPCGLYDMSDMLK